ncbi:MAG: hypothetical protein JWL77_2768 [Chthonomonadaceae bacterium]|nr:hypothetical protein [Chthonomonadaceae bacterium]
MKIGIILECGPEGPDKHVCHHLAKQILRDANIEAELSFATLNNKPNLLQKCGDTASLLILQGCERVLIVWDLYPAWREKGQKPCRYEDRKTIFEALDTASVDRNRVALICIQEELEAWLLADGEVLTGFLQSINSHVKKVSHHKSPERIGCNPKTALNRLMQECTGRKYEDHIHARKIVVRIDDLSRLRKVCVTFQRFEQKVIGR